MTFRRLRSALHAGWTILTLHVIGYFVKQASVLLFQYVFRVRNRLTIAGTRGIRVGKFDLVVSNHITLLDHFLIIVALSWPQMLWRPRSALIGFIADRENFFGTWFLRYYMRLARIVPVDRKREDRMKNGPSDAISASLDSLRKGAVGIYPQGTRVRPSKKESLELGVGLVVAQALSLGMPIRVIPVWLEPDSMDRLQPYAKEQHDAVPGTRGWRIFRRIFGARIFWILDHTTGNDLRIVIGKPIPAADLRPIAEGQRTESRRAVVLTRCIWDAVQQLGKEQTEKVS